MGKEFRADDLVSGSNPVSELSSGAAGLERATLFGEILADVYVETGDGALAEAGASRIGSLELPADRTEFLDLVRTWRQRFEKNTGLKLGAGASLLLPLAACASGGGSSTTGVSGAVVDGPVSGATVFRDVAGTKVYDASVDGASATTNANGSYALAAPSNAAQANAPIVSVGGTDTTTGQAVTAPLTSTNASNGTVVITPITTLIESIAQTAAGTGNTPTASQISAAETQIASALGLNASVASSLTSASPSGSTETANAALGSLINNIVSSVNSTASNNGVTLTQDQLNSAALAVVNQLATNSSTSNALSLSNTTSTTSITSLLNQAASATDNTTTMNAVSSTATSSANAIAADVSSDAVSSSSSTGISSIDRTVTTQVATNLSTLATSFHTLGITNPIFSLASGGAATVTLTQLQSALTTLGSGSSITFNLASGAASGTEIVFDDTGVNLLAALTAGEIHGTAVLIQLDDPDSGNTTAYTLTLAQYQDSVTQAAYNFTAVNGQSISIEVTASATLDAGTSLGSYAVSVDSGQTLTLTAAQATGHTITGAGTVAISDTTISANTDLHAITASLSLGSSLSVATSKTLTLSAAQATGHTITGAGTVAISDTVITADTDLHAITATLSLNSSLLVATIDQLTLTAAQASGQTITGAGTVAISSGAITADTDLHLISAHLSFSGSISVASGKTLTLSAAEASGLTISGAGTVTISDSTIATNTDLTGITTDLLFHPSTIVANGVTLTLTAEEADGRALGGTSAAIVAISDSTISADTDLSGITASLDLNGSLAVASGVTLTVTAAQVSGLTITGAGTVAISDSTITANTDLHAIAANLSLSGSLSVATGETLTLTAAQATGHTITGAGTVAISDTTISANTNLSGITATLSLDSALTISSGDTLTLTAAGASGQTITGAGTVASPIPPSAPASISPGSARPWY